MCVKRIYRERKFVDWFCTKFDPALLVILRFVLVVYENWLPYIVNFSADLHLLEGGESCEERLKMNFRFLFFSFLISQLA